MNNLLVLITLLIVCVGSASGVICYFCANCPNPFNPYSASVSTVVSSTGYCAKKSASTAYGAPAGRGPAEAGLCYSSGCRWLTDRFGVRSYTCCCTRDYCNTGSMTSKSTVTMLVGALALVAFNRFI